MFESKSQLLYVPDVGSYSCYEYLKNNVWKQITTESGVDFIALVLLRISKEQCLKANHNAASEAQILRIVVTNI